MHMHTQDFTMEEVHSNDIRLRLLNIYFVSLVISFILEKLGIRMPDAWYYVDYSLYAPLITSDVNKTFLSRPRPRL